MQAPFGWEQIRKFYGWEERFLADLASWEARMKIVPAPQGCHFFYDKDVDGMEDVGEFSKGIRVHQAIFEETQACFEAIRDAGLWSFIESQAGGYVFRTQRGSKKLSMHSLGAAIDFDPRRNPFRAVPETTALGTMPGIRVVKIFEARGWTWGGRWDRADSMHFQFGGGF